MTTSSEADVARRLEERVTVRGDGGAVVVVAAAGLLLVVPVESSACEGKSQLRFNCLYRTGKRIVRIHS